MFEHLFRPIHLLVILFIALLVFWPQEAAGTWQGLGRGTQELQRVHER